MSPESILRLIFSRSLSCRSGSRLGVEHLELSLELSLPLLLPSFTMAGFLLYRVGAGAIRGLVAKPHVHPTPEQATPVANAAQHRKAADKGEAHAAPAQRLHALSPPAVAWLLCVMTSH